MSTPKHDPFSSIADSELRHVAGGAARVTVRQNGGSDQLMQMMNQITDSLKSLSQNNNQNDPMQMMLMMMMMGGLGGGGGGGGGAVAAPPQSAPAPAPVINISTTVKRHGW